MQALRASTGSRQVLSRRFSARWETSCIASSAFDWYLSFVSVVQQVLQRCSACAAARDGQWGMLSENHVWDALFHAQCLHLGNLSETSDRRSCGSSSWSSGDIDVRHNPDCMGSINASGVRSWLLTYETVHAPPATVFLQPLHFQMPTACRLTVFLPQNVHT